MTTAAPTKRLSNHYGKKDWGRYRTKLGLKPSRGWFFQFKGAVWLPIWEAPDPTGTFHYRHKAFDRHAEMVRYNAARAIVCPRTLMSGLLTLIADREVRRRQNPEYAGFIVRLIDDPANRGTHYRAFADWLSEQGREMESRKVMQFVKEVGL